MKKLVVLLIIFLGLGAFVYFYEIGGQEERQKAQELEESLFRLERDAIERIEISRSDNQSTIVLSKENDNWIIEQPIQAPADQSAVDSLLSSIDSATRDRTLSIEEAESEAAYGLDQPRYELRVSASEEERILLIGGEDFTGSNVYTQLAEDPQVHLTSNSLATALDKEASDFRSKDILKFSRSDIDRIEVSQTEQRLVLERRDGQWYIQEPVQDRASDTTVSSLLSTLETARAQEFVAEEPEDLSEFGLAEPIVRVRLRNGIDETWAVLEIGDQSDENYVARDVQRSPVFTVAPSVYEAVTKGVWEFRNKDVVDVEQDRIERLRLSYENQEIIVRRDELKWIIESPEEQSGQGALAYKFWYPIDDIEFESISEEPVTFEPQITVEITLQDGSEKQFEFGRRGDEFWARDSESGRQGQISSEDYEGLQLDPNEIV